MGFMFSMSGKPVNRTTQRHNFAMAKGCSWWSTMGAPWVFKINEPQNSRPPASHVPLRSLSSLQRPRVFYAYTT